MVDNNLTPSLQSQLTALISLYKQYCASEAELCKPAYTAQYEAELMAPDLDLFAQRTLFRQYQNGCAQDDAAITYEDAVEHLDRLEVFIGYLERQVGSSLPTVRPPGDQPAAFHDAKQAYECARFRVGQQRIPGNYAQWEKVKGGKDVRHIVVKTA